jgi:hypothetical protein
VRNEPQQQQHRAAGQIMVEQIRPRRIAPATTGEGTRSRGVTTAAVLLLVVTLPLSHAFPHYADQIPNGRAVPNINGGGFALGVGHGYAGGGGPRNPFGDDFLAQNHVWTTALCQMDSDRDGRTNGVELGDPDCTWVAGSGVAPSGPALSHPGVADVDDGSVDNDHSNLNNDEKPQPVAEPSEPAPSPPGNVNGEKDNPEPPVEALVAEETVSTPETNQSTAEEQQPPVTATTGAAGGACGTNDDCLGGLVCGENGVCVSNHHHDDDGDKDNAGDSGSSNLLVNGHPDAAEERISKVGRLRGPFGRPAVTLFVGVTMLLSLMLVLWAAGGCRASSFLPRRQQQQSQQSYRPVVVHDDDDE